MRAIVPINYQDDNVYYTWIYDRKRFPHNKGGYPSYLELKKLAILFERFLYGGTPSIFYNTLRDAFEKRQIKRRKVIRS